tara:strand:- start:1436 stop:2269 length:834 start_codon:yes stop_codon:yes gene_type:complete
MKLENRMKERLEKRNIDPSPAAWERIAAKLETQAVVKKSNRKLWVAIAASFIGGVIATLIIINQQSLIQNNAAVVITPEIENNTSSQEERSELNKAAEVEEKLSSDNSRIVETKNPLVEENAEQKRDNSTQNRSAVTVVIKDDLLKKEVVNNTSITNDAMSTSIAIIESSQKLGSEETAINSNPDIKKAIEIQVKSLVAAVDMNTVSDEEIDALLKNAQREIISNRVFNGATGRVDANALLLDVEAEVDPQSFRDKIFEALATGFEKARSALVDRNN